MIKKRTLKKSRGSSNIMKKSSDQFQQFQLLRAVGICTSSSVLYLYFGDII